MATKLTKDQLTQLNDLIKDHYGEPYNVFFFQGLFVSYLAWPKFCVPEELISKINLLIPLIKPLPAKKTEFEGFLLPSLYNETIRSCKAVNIVPMISFEQVKGKIFKYMLLEDEYKHNLLDWLIGYFVGFYKFWDQKIITKYMKRSKEDLEVLRYYAGINTLQFTVYNLVNQLNFKAKSPLYREIIENINSSITTLDDFTKAACEMSGKVALCKVIGEILSNVNYICIHNKK